MNKKNNPAILKKFQRLSNILYNTRKRNLYTLKELSYHSGVSSALISTLENCKTSSIPTQSTLMKLETALGMEEEEFQKIFDYIPKKSSYMNKVMKEANRFGNFWKEDISCVLKKLEFSEETISEILNFIQIRLYQNIDEPWFNSPIKFPEEFKLKLKLAIKEGHNAILRNMF